jgi:hypothetical protein
MERTPVASSDVASVGYESDSATLEVEFLNGAIYQYFGVPEDIYQGLMNAGSKGSFLSQAVKKSGYSYQRVS